MKKKADWYVKRIGITVLGILYCSAMTVFADLTPQQREEMIQELNTFYEASGMDAALAAEVTASFSRMSDTELESLYEEVMGLDEAELKEAEEQLESMEQRLEEDRTEQAEEGQTESGVLSAEEAGTEGKTDVTISGDSALNLLDSYMGNAVYDQEIGPVRTSFDSANGLYQMEFEDGSVINTNIRNGMTIDQYAVVTLPASASLTFTRNGEPYEYVRGNAIREEGLYRLLFNLSFDREVKEEDAETVQTYTQHVSGTYEFFFRIITEPTNKLCFYNLPEESAFQSVLLNGEAVLFDPSVPFYHMVDNGTYTFTIQDTAFSDVVHTVSINYDTVPAFLTITGVNDKGLAYRDVTMEKQEQDSMVTCYLENVQFTPQSYVFSQPGSYIIQSTDKAGNFIAYTFHRMYTIDSMGYLSIVLSVLALCGLIGYCVWLRKHMRIR